ncbi:hypothetical protein ES705_04431 [subsurface metagenome]
MVRPEQQWKIPIMVRMGMIVWSGLHSRVGVMLRLACGEFQRSEESNIRLHESILHIYYVVFP